MGSGAQGGGWAALVGPYLFQEQVGPGPDPHWRECFQVDKLKWCVCVVGVGEGGRCSREIQLSVSPEAGSFTRTGSEPALPCSLNPRDRLNGLISAPGWHRETQQLHPPPLSGATERAGIGSGTCFVRVGRGAAVRPSGNPSRLS